MPTVTLVPEAVTQGSAFWTVTGAASHVAAVTDASDSSYIQLTTGDNTDLGFSMTDIVIPSDGQVVSATLSCRARHATGSGTLDTSSVGFFSPMGEAVNTTLATYTESAVSLTQSRAAWNAMVVQHPSLAFYLGIRIYEISISVTWERVSIGTIPVGF